MGFIGVPAFFVLILGLVALKRGHLSWARITNRRTAGIVSGIAGVVLVVAVALDPSPAAKPQIAAVPAIVTPSTVAPTTAPSTTAQPSTTAPTTTVVVAPPPVVTSTVQPTTTAPPAPTPTTTTTTTPPVTTMADTGLIPAPADNPSPADVAKQVHVSCVQFEESVDPVIRSNVAADVLAPIIRLHMGILPDSTTGTNDPNPPYLLVANGFSSEVSDDPGFQPIEDAINALGESIIQADPSGDLHEIASAAGAVTHQCEALHALP